MPTSLTWLFESAPAPAGSGGESSAVPGGATGDLKLAWSNELGAADLSVSANDIERESGLQTAVLLSLFTDRQAEAGDVLPDGGTDRRGWWADAFPDVDGDRIGSRLWLLSRAKPAEWVGRAAEYAKEALAWLVEDQVAERIEATASVPSPGLATLDVEIYRPQQQPTRFKFVGSWRAEES